MLMNTSGVALWLRNGVSPLEGLNGIVTASAYNAQNRNLTLTLQDGSTLVFRDQDGDSIKNQLSYTDKESPNKIHNGGHNNS